MENVISLANERMKRDPIYCLVHITDDGYEINVAVEYRGANKEDPRLPGYLAGLIRNAAAAIEGAS